MNRLSISRVLRLMKRYGFLMIVAATVLAQRQHVTTSEFLLGCALGLFGTAAVEVVRLRDATQPPVLGASLAPDRSARALPRIVFAVCVVGAYAILIVAAVRDVGVVGAAAALLSFPAALRALGVGVRTNSAVVLESLARQALHAYMWFALLLVAGALCGAVTWALLR